AAGSGSNRHKAGGRMRRNDSSSAKVNDTAVAIIPQRATVWVVDKDSLIRKKIVVGLNDDTHVEVLHGLSEEDEVVDAVQDPALQPAASAGPAKSPFLPQRRRNSNPKKPPQPR
ncbi:MAG TPA: hypothetical protein VGM24_08350, partial [Puia sp.]